MVLASVFEFVFVFVSATGVCVCVCVRVRVCVSVCVCVYVCVCDCVIFMLVFVLVLILVLQLALVPAFVCFLDFVLKTPSFGIQPEDTFRERGRERIDEADVAYILKYLFFQESAFVATSFEFFDTYQ